MAKKPYDPQLYTVDFSKPTYVTLYGIKCKLPTEQPDHQCINYNKPVHEQKFQRTHVPADLYDWQYMGQDKLEEMEKFIADEYHKRKNGVWIFIKGTKYYIPGVFYYFLNYWVMEKGDKPKFKITDMHFFQVWFHVVRDPLCYGLIVFKPRRIGDTEKAICILYEYGTRVRNVKCGMQSFTEEHIKETFTERMVYAHDRMVWFMKPINRGSTNPQEGLELDYPVGNNSAKAIADRVERGESATTSSQDMFLYPPLKSKIDYKTSKPKSYDGKLLGRYYVDEFGKWDDYDPNDAWGYVKMALKDETTDEIIGKAIMTSTIEEMGKDGVSLERARELCDDSDPDSRDANGETTSGLYRILRTYEDKAPVDDWGYPMLEKVRIKRENKIKNLIAKRKMTEMFRYKRQNPENWDDVFLSTQETSGMNQERLYARKQEIKDSKKPLYFRGNLEWKDGIKFNPDGVVLVPDNQNGHCWFSHEGTPEKQGAESNATSHRSLKMPGNIDLFCGGVDPYEEKDSIDKNPSKGAITIRRVKDMAVDSEQVIVDRDEMQDGLSLGDPKDYGRHWKTNKVLMCFLHRFNDPNDFYEYVIKVLVFYGVDALIEKNKGRGLMSYMELNGYGGYIQERPEFTKTDYSKNSNEQGITATEGSTEQWMGELKAESEKMANSIDIPIYIDQVATLNYKNRGKKDLGVSGGLAHLAGKRNVRVKKREDKNQEQRKRRYFTQRVV